MAKPKKPKKPPRGLDPRERSMREADRERASETPDESKGPNKVKGADRDQRRKK